MNLSDATSPEPTPQKKKHSRRRGQFLGVDNLDLSIDSEEEDLVTQNEKLKQENEQLRKRVKRLQGTKKAPPVRRQTCPPKPWSQLSNRRKLQLVKDVQAALQDLANAHSTSVISVSANIIHRHARILNEPQIAGVAKKIEQNAALSGGTMSPLVASWLMVRGKSGGLSKIVYRQIKKVFRTQKLCTLPAYNLVTDYWRRDIMTPIEITREGSSEVG